MRTRASAAPSNQPDSSKDQPPKQAVKPSKAFILPSSASQDARFVTLPNPRSGDPTRYFFCPKLGVYEFTVVASSPQLPRSILYTSSKENAESSCSQGTISKTAELLVATPIDAAFFMVPLLAPTSPNQGKRLFQPLDDIIDSDDELPKHLRSILYNDSFRDLLLKRVDAICESVEAGDEKLFRLSEAKLLQELIAKAERMVAQGLPASLEERFVKQALAMPLMSVTRNDINTSGATTTTSSSSPPNPDETESESQESKDTPSTTTTTSTTPASTTPASESTRVAEQLPDQPTCPDAIVRLQRISTALSFMKSSYLSAEMSAKLDEMLAEPDSPIDFKPLQDYLKYLADLRAEAIASRPRSDFSRKRTAEDEDAAESRAEKKRRKEEEEKKKKAGESRGVRELKKVNTNGMKKMSDFFSKAAAAKKKP